MWQVVPTKGQPALPSALSPEGHASGAAVQVRPLPQGLHLQRPPGVAPAQPLERAAARLPTVQQVLRREVKPAEARAQEPQHRVAAGTGTWPDATGRAAATRVCRHCRLQREQRPVVDVYTGADTTAGGRWPAQRR